MRWIPLVLLLACGGGGGTLPAPVPVLTAVKKYKVGQPVKAVLIGTSVGCGYFATGWEMLGEDPNGRLIESSRRDTRVRSAAIMLLEKLRQANPNSDLVNLSGDGWDTADHFGTGRFPGVNSIQDAIAQRPDVVFLAVQINDLQIGRTTFTQFQANTRAMVQTLLNAGLTPVLVKENDVPYGVNGGKFMADYAAEIDAVAVEKKVAVVDCYSVFHTALKAAGGDAMATGAYHDVIHPNGQGHQLLFNQFSAYFN